MVAKQAGQFAGGFFNNPGVVAIIGILIAIGIPLLIFRKNISDFFSQGFPDIQLPSIELPDINIPNIFEGFELPSFELPTFPEITFPEFPTFEFPTFEFPDIFGGLFNGGNGMTDETAEDFTESGMAAARGARGGAPDVVSGITEPFRDAARFAMDFPEAFIPEVEGPERQVQTLLDTGQQFFGGGPSFIGGTVSPTPIERLSLSQIIDMGLAETASQAANLRAIAQGFTPEEEAFLNQGPVDVGGFVAGGPPQVSDPRFEGLSLTEIALRLTGGPISNF